MMTAKKKNAKKSSVKPRCKKAVVPTFENSNRHISLVPLNLISANPGNPQDFRDKEIMPNLHSQGYRIFPTGNTPTDKALWTMLNGSPHKDPDINLRAQAVHLIQEFEPHLLEMGQSIENEGLIKPVQIVFLNGEVGIESGLLRCLSKSAQLALEGKAPGVIEAEVSADRDEATIQSRATVENLHLIANRPMAVAALLKIMKDIGGWSTEEIARRIGRTDQTVRNYLDLCELPSNVQQGIADGLVSLTDAREVVQHSRQANLPISDAVAQILPEFAEHDQDGDEDEVEFPPVQSRRRLKKRKSLSWDKVFVIFKSLSNLPDQVVLDKMSKDELITLVRQVHNQHRDDLLAILGVDAAEAGRLVMEDMDFSDLEI